MQHQHSNLREGDTPLNMMATTPIPLLRVYSRKEKATLHKYYSDHGLRYPVNLTLPVIVRMLEVTSLVESLMGPSAELCFDCKNNSNLNPVKGQRAASEYWTLSFDRANEIWKESQVTIAVKARVKTQEMLMRIICARLVLESLLPTTVLLVILPDGGCDEISQDSFTMCKVYMRRFVLSRFA